MRLYVEEPSLERGRAGLVPVRVMVTRDGHSFEQTVWKRPEELESSRRPGERQDEAREPDLVVSDAHVLDHVPDLERELGRPRIARASQRLTDRHVLEHLLHDDVLALLGGRDEGRLVGIETVHVSEHEPGLFPGDGEHHPGRVHVRRYAYPHGVVTIKRNHNALKIHVHRGSLDRPEGLRELVKFKIRDRRYDGSERANQSPLTDWVYHGRTDEPHPHAVELSIYSRDPRHHHGDVTGDHAMAEFLAEPFSLAGSEDFLPTWRRAFELAGKTALFPGQVAPSLPGAAQHFTVGVEPLLAQLGYQRIDNLPSHWNVVHYLKKVGYEVPRAEDRQSLADLREALDHLGAARTARGEPVLTRAQESWVVLLQSPAFRGKGVPPPDFDLGGTTYPLWLEDDGTARNIWMTKPVSQGAKP